jgi:PAS domain S-box-containing protein
MAEKPAYEALEQRVRTLEEETARLRGENEGLRGTGDELARIFRENPVPCFVIDKDRVLTHHNRAFEALTGLSPNEFIGTRKQWKPFYSKKRPVLSDFIVDAAPEEEITRFYGDHWRRSDVTQGSYELEAFFSRLGVEGKWLRVNAVPVKDNAGELVGAIEVLHDITEKKKDEDKRRRSERRFRALLQFLPYPLAVFTLKGRVIYVNPAFTRVFGWDLEELEGGRIPFVPPELREETLMYVKRLYREKNLFRHETRRTTKDGRTLDVAIRATVFSETGDESSGVIAILRDITHDKRIANINETILRISTAIPEYPDLEDLLDYVNRETKRLIDTEGSVVILRDDRRGDLFVLGAAYDTKDTLRKAKKTRFSMDQLIAGRVIRTGKPVIVNDTSLEPELHRERDGKLGYKTRNLLLVPLKGRDRIIGVLCAINKKAGHFDHTDTDLLNIIAGTVALSVENARVSLELKKAYEEVTSLNRAKDKVINHLSHELKTPVAILSGTLDLLMRVLAEIPEKKWETNMDRARRNLDRIKDIQYEAQDIMGDKPLRTYDVFALILDQCADELETLIARHAGEGPVIQAVRKNIEEIFGPKEMIPEIIPLGDYLRARLETLKPHYSHRRVNLITRIQPTPPLYVPAEPLGKVIDGLVRNAVENTPDEGKIEVTVKKQGEGTSLVVRDYGIGITADSRKRIFEGFFTTQDTMAYSSKRPFDFGAGGKGADLLRMKIFSERYNFKIEMTSSRCGFIPREKDICPGRISACSHCTRVEDCHDSGGTTFSLYFPPAPEKKRVDGTGDGGRSIET